MDCPFCKIDKEKTRVIKEGKNVMVILSNPRLVEGHLLVIPKRHVEKISELNEEELKESFEKIIEFQQKILSKISPGCDVRQNYRPFIKQSNFKVDHLHFHLLPRKLKDEIYQKSQIFEKQLWEELIGKEAEKISKLLKK